MITSIPDEKKETIKRDLGEIELSTTDEDKSAIGYLNDCVQRLTWPREFHIATIPEIKNYVEHYYNENLTKTYITPKQMMGEKLNIPFKLHGY